ncbi:glucose-6-phosphate isomerase [Hyphobacterium sp. HN65]|uniref:Glucose-6-phosphate isomerase n=1 Tax=Hyphobacterium lacteum TaxID=3116575 RepID=A0ABU7LN89_9PROT|nr:glucose-6-phosphate isomerase [Hyphobacterium sp. HN65]MEE2525381.1 glucose-6-phosphate isomerase [Hyphobacterium sp. HN65]
MAMTREQAVEAIIELGRKTMGNDARDHFSRDEGRLDALTLDAAGLYFDFSKQPYGRDDLSALLTLAAACGLEQQIAAMLSGDVVNTTENRAAQHVALRGGGIDKAKIEQAAAERERAYDFAEKLRSGQIATASGKPFTHILHIGIGGSDLGPRLLYEAMRQNDDPLAVRFLSSVDPEAFASAIEGLDPATTMVFVVSKSFGTPETTENFKLALDWLKAELGEDAGRHLVAATANRSAAIATDVEEARIFDMWDWVGGRYSLWSAVSLSVIAAIGPKSFDLLLAGARDMDSHFSSAAIENNAPAMSALTIYWHQLTRGVRSWAVVPYAFHLRLFVAWLQQLFMESLGKGVSLSGESVAGPTGPAVWGGEGPDGQHAFFQLLHQGAAAVPVDIIAFANDPRGDRQPAILANAIAQAEALLAGRDGDTVRSQLETSGLADAEKEVLTPHMVMPGGRGSTFILADKLDARSLGALLAFYEHQTFALSVLMGINAFDQFGVELGKKLAARLEKELRGAPSTGHDTSTNALLERLSGPHSKRGDSDA